MNQYWTAAIAAGIVLVIGLMIRAYITRKGGTLVSAESRRSMTGFAMLAATLAGLASLAVALNPSTIDVVVISLLQSLPGLLLAGVIIVLAVLLGRITAALVRRALTAWSAVLAGRIARVVKVAVISVGLIIAMDQLGVSTNLLITLVTAVVGAVALALALAVGLGSVPMARQVAAGRHVSDRFAIGDSIAIDDARGVIAEINLSSTSLETGKGRVEVPNEMFLNHVVEIERLHDDR